MRRLAHVAARALQAGQALRRAGESSSHRGLRWMRDRSAAIDRERLGAIAFVAFGVFALYLSVGLPIMTTAGRVGAGMFPVSVSVGIIALSLWLLSTTFVIPEAVAEEATVESPVPRREVWMRGGASVLVMLIMLLALSRLGYVLTMTAAVSALMWLFGERRPLVVLPLAIGGVVATYLLFALFLNVRLQPFPQL
jgi:hypothetical protein